MDRFVTLFNDAYQEFGEMCVDSAVMHYDSVTSFGMLEASIHPAWNKLLAVRQVIKESSAGDWVIWVDADSIVNSKFSMCELSSQHAANVVFPSSPIAGICSCAFGMKVCDWSVKFIDALLLCGDVVDPDKYWKNVGCKFEENAIKYLMNEFPAIGSKILKTGNSWCATGVPWIDDPQFNIAVHHFGALDRDTRLKRMRQALNKKYE